MNLYFLGFFSTSKTKPKNASHVFVCLIFERQAVNSFQFDFLSFCFQPKIQNPKPQSAVSYFMFNRQTFNIDSTYIYGLSFPAQNPKDKPQAAAFGAARRLMAAPARSPRRLTAALGRSAAMAGAVLPKSALPSDAVAPARRGRPPNPRPARPIAAEDRATCYVEEGRSPGKYVCRLASASRHILFQVSMRDAHANALRIAEAGRDCIRGGGSLESAVSLVIAEKAAGSPVAAARRVAARRAAAARRSSAKKSARVG